MGDDTNEPFIRGLQQAWRREQASARIYRALAEREPAETRRKVLLKLAATEVQHGERWAARLRELGAPLLPDRDMLRDRVWRWVLMQSGTDTHCSAAGTPAPDPVAVRRPRHGAPRRRIPTLSGLLRIRHAGFPRYPIGRHPATLACDGATVDDVRTAAQSPCLILDRRMPTFPPPQASSTDGITGHHHLLPAPRGRRPPMTLDEAPDRYAGNRTHP